MSTKPAGRARQTYLVARKEVVTAAETAIEPAVLMEPSNASRVHTDVDASQWRWAETAIVCVSEDLGQQLCMAGRRS